jgi:flagellar basal-body rod protein FlgF
MGNGIYIALSGAVAQSSALDITADNVANAGTVGFRADRMAFGKVLGKATGKDAAYVGVATTKADTSAGAIKQTGNPLDLALSGDGFFAIDTPRGTRYTRAGDFSLDAKGRIVNPDGFTARAKGGGSITVPPGSSQVSVDATGTVYADDQKVGALELARFAPGNVVHEGKALYAAAPGAQTQMGDMPQVIGGAVEQGNFNVVRGVIDLVKISRTYDALHRMIESYKQIDERTATSVGNPK